MRRHGTVSSYNAGCRCDSCRPAAARARAAHRARARNTATPAPAPRKAPVSIDNLDPLDGTGATTRAQWQRGRTDDELVALERSTRNRAAEHGYRLTRDVTRDGSTVTVTLNTTAGGSLVFSGTHSRDVLRDVATWLHGRRASA